MVVGEPLLMGGDVEDEGERMITRLENNHNVDFTMTTQQCMNGSSTAHTGSYLALGIAMVKAGLPYLCKHQS